MRILYIALVELDVPGGPTIHVANLMKGFNAIEMEVKLLCPRPIKKAHGMSGYHYRMIPFFGYSPLRLFLFNLISVYYMFTEIVGYKPHALCVRDRPGNIVAWFFSKILNIPFFIEMNGVVKRDYPHSVETGNTTSLLKKMYRYFRRKQFKKARGFIFNCPSLQKKYTTSFQIQVPSTVISMHVDTTVFKILSREKCRKSLNIDQTSFVIGYVGNFAPRHDIELLLRLLQHLRESNVNAELLLVGSDSNHRLSDNHLFDSLNNRIHVTGWISHSDVPLYLNAMDVGTAFVKNFQGNNPDSFLKVKEYLACGVPVLFNSTTNSFKKHIPFGVAAFHQEDAGAIPLTNIAQHALGFRNYDEKERKKLSLYISNNYSLAVAARKTATFLADSYSR